MEKQIIITSISLTNFKGIAQFSASFDSNETVFRGENGTGKTTLCDAFMWVLFGKDSSGRSDTNFQLKTLDSDNRVIPNIPHEVTVCLSVDGEYIELRKCYIERYVKKRGKAEPVFDGHDIERYWNNVPLTETEYKNRIAEDICAEETFKLITSPTYFLTQKAQDQRRFLINLVGDVKPQDLAEANPRFSELVKVLESKTLDEYTKQLAATLKRIKADKVGIPERIDERKRDVPKTEDWSAIQTQIDALNAKMSEIDNALADKAKASSELANERLSLQSKINTLRQDAQNRRYAIEQTINQDYWTNQNNIREIQNHINRTVSAINDKQSMIDGYQDRLIQLGNERNDLLKEWHSINDMMFVADDNALVCPTCGRPFDSDRQEAIIAKMKEDFNTRKSNMLESNKSKGLKVKTQKENVQKSIQVLTDDIESLNKSVEQMRQSIPDTIAKPNADEAVKNDSTYKLIMGEINALQAKMNSLEDGATSDTAGLKTVRISLSEQITELNKRLMNRVTIELNEKRIAELEQQYKDICAEEVRIEGMFDVIAEYKKAFINRIEGSINDMFTLIKFKLYETLNNGNEREVCEALLDGVPYSTNVNTAGKINAGMDFIRAIQRKYGIYAPVWVDNRESITSLLKVDTQVINLVKDENYKSLTRI